MRRLLELLLGLDKGFLGREGDFAVRFAPRWPGQQYIGAGTWNFLLALAALLLVIYIYRREGRSRRTRITLAALRGLLLAFVLILLNRPILTLGQSRVEPSVLAILVDDSVSMKVRDGGVGSDGQPISRLQAAVNLLDGKDQALVRDLSRQHEIRLYRFDGDARPVGEYHQSKDNPPAADGRMADLARELAKLSPDGVQTQVIRSIRTVLDDLQGQRVAGVVVLSDGRETPRESIASAMETLKNYGVKIFPIPVGTEKSPRNIEVQIVSVQESAFRGDIVNVKVTVRGSGFEADHPVKLILKDKKTGRPMLREDGSAAQETINLPGDQPVEAELQFKPLQVGTLDLVVEAENQPGELDDEDNQRPAQIAVLDAKIAVLYVDGYPRWDYRYIKNEMIRDKTVDISCLLTSADPNFAQEGDRPIRRFPESIGELLDYDVVLFGDVDPRQFSDAQLQLINEFVSKKGGGFGMVAGPRWSPQAWRNTAIEPILPVSIARVEEADQGNITQGFRPVLTREGAASSIFRFFADKQVNTRFIDDSWQPIFWYCRGVTVKPGVGEVYAEHPTDIGPDGRKAPILVLGRFGAGRTMFSAIDDSWRWRYYTGESIFDTYWVQQLRYLARGKKLGQRRLTLTSSRPSYELGEQIRIDLRILDPQLLQQLPDQIRVEIQDDQGQVIRRENLMRQESQNDLYVGTWTADHTGRFSLHLPAIAGGIDPKELPIQVGVPRLELANPRIDRTLLGRLASETLGQSVELSQARDKLPTIITSAARIIPVEASQPLWNAPLAMALFVLLISAEWILRKMYGML
ncbi:MAG: hypothetical protein IT447_03655 [Phycisphaerales bacterium]|jgi:uncharacterized membrane protein|nr:hypothetical protein [Phycisphaerales bacterium]